MLSLWTARAQVNDVNFISRQKFELEEDLMICVLKSLCTCPCCEFFLPPKLERSTCLFCSVYFAAL